MSKFRENERVSAREALGGFFNSAVPKGTYGVVERTEHGLFVERVVVRFDNGRTETVNASQLKRETGWY